MAKISLHCCFQPERHETTAQIEKNFFVVCPSCFAHCPFRAKLPWQLRRGLPSMHTTRMQFETIFHSICLGHVSGPFMNTQHYGALKSGDMYLTFTGTWKEFCRLRAPCEKQVGQRPFAFLVPETGVLSASIARSWKLWKGKKCWHHFAAKGLHLPLKISTFHPPNLLKIFWQ